MTTGPFLGKTSAAVVTMLALLAVPYLSPRLQALRVVHAPWEPKPVEPSPPPAVIAPLPQGETTLQASQNQATVTNALPEVAGGASDPKAASSGVAVEDFSGHALDAFYKHLEKTRSKQPGAVTRILHYGDSVITSDYVSGTMRRRMQSTYGDAGHGFILVANPWEWYFHNDVSHGAGEGWGSSRVTGPLAKDGLYGVGGVTFTGTPGASAYFGTAQKGSFGKKVSHFDVYYLETPNGGEVEAKYGDKIERFSTKGEAKVSRKKTFTVDDGEAKLALRVVAGNPRLFGVALERDNAGVVYDALGQMGAKSEHWSAMDGAHWTEQMALRDPALIVLQFGTNESESNIAESYERTLRAVVEKLKVAAPNASILIAAPLDRAEQAPGGIRTKPIIKRIVASQRNVAKEAGVAFWNTFEAMGGEGAMAKWMRTGLGGGDYTHPSQKGAEMIGDMFSKALVNGFDAWSRKPK